MSGRQVSGVWCTKDDVLQDLAVATGGGDGLDVDDHCLLYGERPPPRPECDIDDEMKILFGGKFDGVQKFAEPDLKGIMSMIRMVETEEDEDFSNPKTKPNETDLLVISKLNPNVREFVPKSRASQTLPERPDTDKNTRKETLIRMTPSPLADTNTRKQALEKMTPSPLADTNTRKETPIRMTPSPLADINTQKATPTRMTLSPLADINTRKQTLERMTPSPLADINLRKETPIRMTPSPLSDKNTRKETQERMTPNLLTDNKKGQKPSTPTPTLSSTEAEINSLKDKILSKSAKDPYEHRREKNAALATLLRHCTTPPITKVIKEKPIKLYTPEFFERCKAADFKGTDDSSTEIDEITDEPIKDIINEETNPKETTDKDSDIEHTNLTPDVDKELKLDDTEPTSSYELVEQQKSVAKVTEWLSGPKSPKKILQKPVIHTGPIPYKRKEVMSPSSTTSTTIDKKISKHDDKAYVPSSYATELRMRYERNKMEANKPLNIWDNLEDQLKKKDEEIKKKSEQQN